LVSNKNLSQKFPLAVGTRTRKPGPKWPKTYPTYDMTSLTIKQNPELSNFLKCVLEDLLHLFRVSTAF